MMVCTMGIMDKMTNGEITEMDIILAINKFKKDNWGELCEEDCKVQVDYINEWGNESPFIMGVYRSVNGVKFWVGSTLAEDGNGRDVTVLLPEEY